MYGSYVYSASQDSSGGGGVLCPQSPPCHWTATGLHNTTIIPICLTRTIVQGGRCYFATDQGMAAAHNS